MTDVSKAQWRKASRSNGGGNCVEVATNFADQDVILVRDSKHGDDSDVLSFTRAEWTAFLDGAQKGEFNL